ncbi:MAG: hypothetical protein JW753_02470 [Dehalococcoidia bacterium]|nr:hypothetical protein [Dehalococcoidia bacterium]
MAGLAFVLFIISLLAAVAFTAIYLVSRNDPTLDAHDKAIALWGMWISLPILPISGVVCSLSFAGLRRQRTQCRIVPLVPACNADFIMCDEGLYIRTVPVQLRPIWKRIPRGFYDFHPWGSLCMYQVDDSSSTIGLKTGNVLLKLRATDFDEMKHIVLGHVKQWCDRSNEIPARIAKFVAGLLALGVLQVVLDVLVPTPAVPGDAVWYLYAHPLLALNVLIASDTEGMLRLMGAMALLPWGWLLYGVVQQLVPLWSKAKTLDQ